MSAAKIATCSYCGTRVVIALSGKERHELVCNSCGAPLINTRLIHKKPSPAASIQPLFDTQKKKPGEDKREERNYKEKRYKNRRDSEEYKKDRKYRSRDSEDRKWSKEDEDLKRKYKENKYKDRKYQKRKKPAKKRKGLFYWIREAADEIDDIFD